MRSSWLGSACARARASPRLIIGLLSARNSGIIMRLFFKRDAGHFNPVSMCFLHFRIGLPFGLRFRALQCGWRALTQLNCKSCFLNSRSSHLLSGQPMIVAHNGAKFTDDNKNRIENINTQRI